jgi:hypothetical protein
MILLSLNWYMFFLMWHYLIPIVLTAASIFYDKIYQCIYMYVH